MYVTKRNGNIEEVQFDKITKRINKLVKLDEKKYIDPTLVAQKVVGSIFSGITTEELDNESAKICINLCTSHHLYSVLAGRIVVSNLQKKTINKFVEKEELIQEKLGFLEQNWLDWIKENRNDINNMIDYERDYIFDYFGFKTLERAYLTKIGDQIIERPQDMLMRVASFINCGDLALTKKTYDIISQGLYTHASPTLFNSGNNRSQMSSCFLLGTDDSLEGITKTWADVAKISKWGGGIGLHVSNVRAKDTLIKGTNGPSSGIIPMLKVYNEIARYIDQCFVGSTKIFTDKGLIPIEQIKSNDFVFTQDGSLQQVERVYCDVYENKILNIKIFHDYENIKVTPSHPFYVIKNNIFDFNFSQVLNRLKNNIIYPEWIDAKNITKTDFIGFPIPKYVLDNKNLDESDCYVYGLMLGSCLIDDNSVSMWIFNKENAIFIRKYLENNSINFLETLSNQTYEFSWVITSKLKFTRSQFYNNNNDKYIDENLLHLPEDKILWILKGLIETFGKIYNQDSSLNVNNRIILKIRSCNIIDSIKYLCLKLGFLCSYLGNEIDNDKIDTTWIIKIPLVDKIAKLFNIEPEKSFDFMIYNDILYTYLTEINEKSIKTCVYDLEVKNNHNYLTQAGLVHNGGKRKGSIAIYLEPHHPDILAFLDLKKNFGSETERARDLFLAVWVSDLFMKQVEKDGDWYLMCPDKCQGLTELYGDEFEKLYWSYVETKKYNCIVKARQIMKAILDSQLETGTPYIGFKDNINNKSNQKNIGTIKSSNLCVHEDTLILTDIGYQNIKSLNDKQVKIWNGTQWSKVTVKKTGTNKNLVRVNLSNGSYLDCTPEHKFYIEEDIGNSTFMIEVSANTLEKNNKLNKLNLPKPIEKSNDIINSMFCCYQCTTTDILESVISKYLIPFFGSITEKIRWFQFLSDSDGTILLNDSFEYLQIINSEKKFLLDVRLFLHTLGIESKVQLFTKLPTNNIELYKLIIESNELYELSILGFSPKNLKFSKKKNNNNNNGVFVVSVEESFQNVDTYCFTEPLKHMGVFNGIITGQCHEIVEYSDSSEYAVCNLASIAINKCIKPFVKKIFNIYTKDNCKYCRWAKQLLLSKNYFFHEEYVDFNKLKEITGLDYPTFPQIYHDQVYVGGYSDLFKFIKGTFDFDQLYEIAYIATVNLNKIIDINYYPVIEAKKSNIRHRPIAVGIQGLADALVQLKICFDSDEALDFNSKMMETIYLACLTASCDLSKERIDNMKKLIDSKYIFPDYYDPLLKLDSDLNIIYHKLKPNKCELNLNNYIGAYSTFEGSPISDGKFQFDLWSLDRNNLFHKNKWLLLEENIKKYGIRNSLVTALMPTASTSQILGNNECFEFFTNNIYTRRTLAGDFPLVNKYLIDDLNDIGLWSNEMKQMILANNGSISNFNNIPEEIRNLYKNIWEIKQIWVLKNAAARGPFVDQTQSMNIFMAVPDYQKLYSSHFWAWSNGLKTGIYYLRSKAAKDAIKVTVDPNIQKKLENMINNEDEICENCSA